MPFPLCSGEVDFNVSIASNYVDISVDNICLDTLLKYGLTSRRLHKLAAWLIA